MTALDTFRLDQRVAVVTGGGTGLGRAASLALADAGAHVVVCGRSAATLRETVSLIASRGGSAQVEPLDIGARSDVGAVFMRIREQFGHLDVLVNNAAITDEHALGDITGSDWDRVVGVNLGGTFHCCQAFAAIPAGAERAIVNVSSLASTRGVASQAAYSASKGGVEALTRALAVELARSGIRVNAIAPGYFRTRMPAAVLHDERAMAKLLSRIPLRRIGDPAEIGPAILFLASRASAYMTGATVHFDGGYIAR